MSAQTVLAGAVKTKSYKRSEQMYQAVLGFFLGLLALLMLFPLYYVISISFTDASVYREGEFVLFPARLSIAAYEWVLAGRGFWNSFRASLFLVAVGTPLVLLFNSACAYMVSKPDLPGRRLFMGYLLATMLFGAGMIPAYLWIRQLGLLNTWWSLILPGVVSPWTVFVLKSFFQGLPRDLEDAARIDGCNDLQTFWQIVLPLSKAPLAAIGLFAAVGYWNTYFSAVLYISDSDKWPLQVTLQQIVLSANLAQFQDAEIANQLMMRLHQVPPETVKMAATVLVIAPILLVYPFIQKYFAKGVLIGSIKE